MNIEIANRLFELRKQRNLSQEELAEKIGVSRQAVSKWERAESAPDTDNLIELARLYEVSLDDLLFTAEPTTPTENKEAEKKEYVSIGLNGIHVVEKDGSEVHIGLKGIQVKNKSDPDFDEDISQDWETAKENWKKQFSSSLPIPLLVTVAYIVMGFLWNFWHPGWILFFVIPTAGKSPWLARELTEMFARFLLAQLV